MIESRFHHLACGTQDVERLARFYTDVLGLSEMARHFDSDGRVRSIWLDLGGGLLMIERARSSREPVEGVASGFFLLALRVSPAERERLEQRLIRAGAAIESRTEYSSYCRDPDGNRLALSHYPEAS